MACLDDRSEFDASQASWRTNIESPNATLDELDVRVLRLLRPAGLDGERGRRHERSASEDGRQGLGDELILAGEVAVERARGNADPLGDVLHGRRAVAPFREQLGSGVHEALSSSSGIAFR